MTSQYCDIGPTFLGFVDIYDGLSNIIPRHFTVVDLGCAYAPQAFLFQDHAQYIGVDLLTDVHFSAANTTFHHMPIAQFLRYHAGGLDLETTFAICSYVPPWGGDNAKMAREFFPNVFTFYPANHSTECPLVKVTP